MIYNIFYIGVKMMPKKHAITEDILIASAEDYLFWQHPVPWVAWWYDVPKSTLHDHWHKDLPKIQPDLYMRLREALQANRKRHRIDED